MNAKDVVELLAERHYESLFVPECKDGPTWGTNHLRLDAWVLMKSWSKPSTIGYEVKVSRSDFMGDDKWPGYLPLCNELYFVCPWGLIEKNEVPESCGLLYVTKNGKKLRVQKKAPWRDVEVPDSLYRYILMSRVEVVEEAGPKPKDNAKYWEEWLADKEHYEFLGRSVSVELRRRVEERIDKVERESRKIHDENSRLQAVKNAFDEIGIDYRGYGCSRNIAKKFKASRAAFPASLPDDLIHVGEELKKIAEDDKDEGSK